MGCQRPKHDASPCQWLPATAQGETRLPALSLRQERCLDMTSASLAPDGKTLVKR